MQQEETFAIASRRHRKLTIISDSDKALEPDTRVVFERSS